MRVASYLICFNKHRLTFNLLNAITCTQLRKNTCTQRICQLSSAVSEICTQ